MNMNKEMVNRVTNNEAKKTQDYFYECERDGFTKVSNKLIQSGIMAKIGGALATLLALLSCANTKTMQCNPSIEKLMQMTGKSDKAVRNDINKLVSMNLIQKLEAPRKGGKHIYTNNYIITVHLALKDAEMPKRVEKTAELPILKAPNMNAIKKNTSKINLPKVNAPKTVELKVSKASTAEDTVTAAIKEIKKESKNLTKSGSQRARIIESYIESAERAAANYMNTTNEKREEMKETVLNTISRAAYELNILDKYELLKEYAYELVTVLDENFKPVLCKVYFDGRREVA